MTFDPFKYKIKKKPVSRKERIENSSIIKKLGKENKINEHFLITLNRLTIEEIISLKLESACKSSGGNMYGMQIWDAMNIIIFDALAKFAICSTKNLRESAMLLGIDERRFKRILNKKKMDETNSVQ